MQGFLEAGFILREDIMKYQWKTKGTRERRAGLSKVAEEQWVDIDKQSKKVAILTFCCFPMSICLFFANQKRKRIQTFSRAV